MWIEEQNVEFRQEGMLTIRECEIKVIGQTALLEANLSIHVPATMDVDVFANYQFSVMQKFKGLLKIVGKELDPVGHEAWMPKETLYNSYFEGAWVKGFLAQAEYVMVSKAKKAPEKNKALLAEYLALPPPEVFFELAEKYEIDLERFVE